MSRYAQRAFEWSFLLEAGLCAPADVIAWADAIVGSSESYDNSVAEISLAFRAPASELAHLLRNFPGPADEWAALRSVLATMHGALEREPTRGGDFSWFLEQLWKRHHYQLPDEFFFIPSIADQYSCAEDGVYGTEAEATEELLKELSAFRNGSSTHRIRATNRPLTTYSSEAEVRHESALIPALAMALIGMANAQSIPEKPLKNPSLNTMTCSDLHQAAKTNDLPKINEALTAGIPVDCRNGQKQTPLLTATLAGSNEAAKALIAAGADVNAQAENLDSPLLYAGAAGRLEILKLCLAAKPDFTVTNRYGGTALIPACERGHVEVVRELLKTKIPVNHVNNLGWTALLEAVLLSDGGPKHQEIVTLLLAHGADPKIADKEGATPLQHAERRGFTEMIKLLKNRDK